MVFMIVFSSNYHDVICYYYQVFYVTKTFIQLVLEHVPCHCDTKGHYFKSIPAYLSVECC